MKKTLPVLMLAAMLVFAFAGGAFAAGINHSGQTEVGAHGTPDVDPEAVSTAAIYEPWNTTLGSNATDGNSPHGNYTTTTVKCVVCHAVHYAAAGGAPVGSAQTADTLLRMRADEACVMCHATSGMAVNGRPVYNGAGPSIVGPGNSGGATDVGHVIGTNCSYCHTNVHGSGADDSVAALQGYLLKNMSATDVQGTGAPSNNMLEAITAIDFNAQNQGFADGAALGYTIGEFAATNTPAVREQAVGVFCAECHLGAYATNAAGAATNVYGSGTAAFSGHRVGANVTASTNWNADGSKSSGLVQNETIAWAPATTCKSCHDADDNFGNDSFPHSWGQSGTASSKMWLSSAADAVATKTSVGQASTHSYNVDKVQLSDGVCLKCHVADAAGTAGVGINY